MKMYKCGECDKTFNWPKIITECVGECWGLPYHETYGICPHCGSAEIEEVEEYEEIIN